MNNLSNKEVDKELLALREQVLGAAKSGKKLCIAGASTKHFLAPCPDETQGSDSNIEMCSLPSNVGIVSYQPSELVITVRAATKLSDVVNALAEKNQMLGFEPPAFGADATIGGTVASALSGSARPYLGSIRDAVLGTKIFTGTGDVARFGGEVMKNVAGYDISRLFVGSMGSLGMLIEVSLRVQPIAKKQKFLCLRCDEAEALREMTALRKKSLPLTGVAYAEEKLHIRLFGSEIGVSQAQQDLAHYSDDRPTFWPELNEQQLAFFDSSSPLWRLTLPYSARFDPSNSLSEERLWDWGGGLCWVKTESSPKIVCDSAKTLGGAASLFRGKSAPIEPREEKLARLRRKLKAAFDPDDVFLSRGAWRNSSS